MSHFLNWIGSSKLVSQHSQIIADTLTVKVCTLDTGGVFVVAENGLVSYDGGFYKLYESGSETDKFLETFME